MPVKAKYETDLLLSVSTLRFQSLPIQGQPWKMVKRGSPGNTQMFEDILYSSGMNNSSIVMAVCMGGAASDNVLGVAYCDVTLGKIGVCEFIDNNQFSNFEVKLSSTLYDVTLFDVEVCCF